MTRLGLFGTMPDGPRSKVLLTCVDVVAVRVAARRNALGVNDVAVVLNRRVHVDVVLPAQPAFRFLGVDSTERDVEREADVGLRHAPEPDDAAVLKGVVAAGRAGNVGFVGCGEAERARRAADAAVPIADVAVDFVRTGRGAPVDRAAFELADATDADAVVQDVAFVAHRKAERGRSAERDVLREDRAVHFERLRLRCSCRTSAPAGRSAAIRRESSRRVKSAGRSRPPRPCPRSRPRSGRSPAPRRSLATSRCRRG